MELDIAHFGSLSILSPRTAMVRVFATSDGVVARLQPAMVTPPQWEEYIFASSTAENERRNVDRADDEEDDEFSDEDDGDEEHYDYEEDFYFGDEEDYYLGDHDDFEEEGRSYGSAFVKPKKVRRWTEFSGENVGWKFDDFKRMVHGKLMDGWNPITEHTDDGELSEAGKKFKQEVIKQKRRYNRPSN